MAKDCEEIIDKIQLTISLNLSEFNWIEIQIDNKHKKNVQCQVQNMKTETMRRPSIYRIGKIKYILNLRTSENFRKLHSHCLKKVNENILESVQQNVAKAFNYELNLYWSF